MQIDRDRYSPDGAVSRSARNEIEAVELHARDLFVDFIRESGPVVGTDYTARLVTGSELETDLRSHVVYPTGEFIVDESTTDYADLTTVFSLAAQNGVQRELPKSGAAPEYYNLDDGYWKRFGSRLIQAVFEPGAYPELAELATAKKVELFGSDELQVRLTTPEDYAQATAKARLGAFTVGHLGQLLYLYHQVAYPDREFKPRPQDEVEDFHSLLQQGESLGLRTGTQNLDCAKHRLDVDRRLDELTTRMYLNYDIRVGYTLLHFSEDIDMATAFGKKASSYFEEEGLLVV